MKARSRGQQKLAGTPRTGGPSRASGPAAKARGTKGQLARGTKGNLARSAKGHCFAAPAVTRASARGAVQRPRTPPAEAWDDVDAADTTPANAPKRGSKVRSRRPTGAQELRALLQRDTARHQEIQRGEMQRGAERASVRTAGAAKQAPRKATSRTSGHASALPAKAAAERSAPPVAEFRLTGEYIALDNLLKLTGNAPSGGAAKALAAEGAVKVDGVVELRKTCKIRAGQLVAIGTARIRVLARA